MCPARLHRTRALWESKNLIFFPIFAFIAIILIYQVIFVKPCRGLFQFIAGFAPFGKKRAHVPTNLQLAHMLIKCFLFFCRLI
jgi:hypothetical protein